MENKTLFERLGGIAAITAVVEKFYEFMLADPITAPFFAKTDMVKQRASQTTFIAMACGGPNNYTGTDMKSAHINMKIGNKEFDQTWVNLNKALPASTSPKRKLPSSRPSSTPPRVISSPCDLETPVYFEHS